MTAKKDLKQRIRARQQRTGESYTSAREHVLAQREPAEPPEPPRAPVPVLETIDLSAEAERLGLRCRAAMFPKVGERVDGGTVLARLRSALLASEGDESTAMLRAVLLRGERPPPLGRWSLEHIEGSRRFMARAQAGIAGASESGYSLALHVDGKQGGEVVVCTLWPTPASWLRPREPMLILCSPGGLLSELQVLGDGAMTIGPRL
jgi:hypothetical protein